MQRRATVRDRAATDQRIVFEATWLGHEGEARRVQLHVRRGTAAARILLHFAMGDLPLGIASLAGRLGVVEKGASAVASRHGRRVDTITAAKGRSWRGEERGEEEAWAAEACEVEVEVEVEKQCSAVEAALLESRDNGSVWIVDRSCRRRCLGVVADGISKERERGS